MQLISDGHFGHHLGYGTKPILKLEREFDNRVGSHVVSVRIH